jgi:hypothetical protein
MPCYFYSTIGLIYGITYFCFSDCAYHFVSDLFRIMELKTLYIPYIGHGMIILFMGSWMYIKFYDYNVHSTLPRRIYYKYISIP